MRNANIRINAYINRYAWVSWLFIYLSEFIFFVAFRWSNLHDLVEVSTTPDEDSTITRICGLLLGIVEDFVVITFLVLVLFCFDTVVSCSTCWNDTAPNGCLDCFIRGVPFRLRSKLIFKRLFRLLVVYAACLVSVIAFTMDKVAVRSYRCRYEFDKDWSREKLVVTDAQAHRAINHVLLAAMGTQGIIAIAITIWFDLTRWTPLNLITSRPSLVYFVMAPSISFDSDMNDNPSEFFDSNNCPIRGTQPPRSPAILSEEVRGQSTSRLKFVLFGVGCAIVTFIVVPLFVLLVTHYCSPAVASIALNADLNEAIRYITTLSLTPT